MNLDFLTRKFENRLKYPFLIWKDDSYSYGWLLQQIREFQKTPAYSEVKPGCPVLLEADFSPKAVALFLALIQKAAILIPLSQGTGEAKKKESLEIAKPCLRFSLNAQDELEVSPFSHEPHFPYYEELKKRKHPGLVLFSSGSTGKIKAAVHDFAGILEKFKTPRHDFITIAFLLFDHIGGIDTLFYALSNGSLLVTLETRDPELVAQTIQKYQVEVLPVTPSFLNLLILSGAYQRYSLSSLKYITYGTELMPEITLQKLKNIFPNVILFQKYGTTEVGTLRSKSESSDSLWVKVGGEGYQTRVVDGMLEIKADSAMLGYLNAPSPFTSGGWFQTGDLVEVKGEYVKFLGRASELINVGGQKVYPAEVENIIQQVVNVKEVTVYGEKNPLLGQIVCAQVSTNQAEEPEQVAEKIQIFCRQKLESYKVPVKVLVTSCLQTSDRFKKKRIG
ncbi:MAG: long-chain fatty acid--CoA ligase [Candidatus Omnitrophica bacterium]|nr:long-chain fatty acid--CoA ligase [Candidatus Omnitrophota bacterium]